MTSLNIIPKFHLKDFLRDSQWANIFPVCLVNGPRCNRLGSRRTRLCPIDSDRWNMIVNNNDSRPVGARHSGLFTSVFVPQSPWCSSHPSAHLRSEILCARRPVLTSAFLLNRAHNITQGPGCDGLPCFGARRRQGRQLGSATLGSIFITRKQKENASSCISQNNIFCCWWAEIIKDALGK